MKAALLKEFARPLVLEEVAMPVPGPGQIVLEVSASGVCHTDLHIARGEWEIFKSFMSLPVIPGHEVAGRVVQVGPGVSQFRQGDAAGVAWFHHTCGGCRYCHEDLEVFCENPQITGVTVNGGFAQYVLAWASHAIPIPGELPLLEVAPLFCAGATVYSALRKVDLQDSNHLVVWGAGGLGQLAIQLAKLAGARVTAVDAAADKLDVAADLGADHMVLAPQADAWFEAFENRGDVALVCAPSLEAYKGAFRNLRKAGALLVVGLPAGQLVWTPGELVRSGVRIIPSRVSSRQELRELLALAARGAVKSRVRAFPLEEINEVLEHLEKGAIEGRAVIDFERG